MALAEDSESGLRFSQRKVSAGHGDQPVGRLLCQGQWMRRKTCYLSGSLTAKAHVGHEEGLRGQPAWQGQAGLWFAALPVLSP